jgi:meso-butanediol dehydrogenase / (S,S)-butanediol dehydrogenase / diacetyl reductase
MIPSLPFGHNLNQLWPNFFTQTTTLGRSQRPQPEGEFSVLQHESSLWRMTPLAAEVAVYSCPFEIDHKSTIQGCGVAPRAEATTRGNTRMRGLEGKRVVITGGASGIGAATAARFLDEGAKVCVLDRDPRGRDHIAKELPRLSGVLAADVAVLPEVKKAFADAVARMGGVDVLINNAGISIRHNFLDITPTEWDKVIAVNLTGVFYVAQTAARHMVEQGAGVILQTASTNGLVGHPYYADYNATKAGVIQLTRTMAIELAPKVRVNAVAPGYVLTPMQRAEYSDAMLDEVNQKIPLRRHAQPEEVAALFAFLASDDAAYITGHVYTIDGAEAAGGMASR